ncbi:MAG: PQQ-binding-like beta-propeller repeat protein [Planctomycetes bacterium]|nr:PQQ-binding-like beta-propeller repeat protein [Planctomycetota bacterium]
MALKGDLASVDLAQVFQMLALNQKEGMLLITAPRGWRALYFDHRGTYLYFDEHVVLERVLVQATRTGRIEPDLAQDARDHAAQHGLGLADALVNGGYLDPEELTAMIRAEMEEEVYDLFFWEEAHFEFLEGRTALQGRDGQIDDRFVFSPDSLIMEAARRIDEWTYIQSRIPSANEIHRPIGNAANFVELEDSALGVYDLVDGKRNVARLIEVSGLPAFHVYKGLAVLCDQGLVEPVPPRELIGLARECVDEGRSQDAVNLFEKAISCAQGVPDAHEEIAACYDQLQEFELAAYHRKCLAEFLVRVDDLPGAVRGLRRIVEMLPTDLAARERIVELTVGRQDLATPDFDPVQAGKDLVDLYLAAGEVDRVRAVLERLLRDNPYDVELKKSLVNVHTKVGDTKRVVELYESIAGDYVQQRRPIDAIKYLQKVLMIDRSRKDVSERIRSLYEIDERRRSRRRSIGALIVLVLIVVTLGAVWWAYDQHARETLESLQVRLQPEIDHEEFESALDQYRAFRAQYPLTIAAREVEMEVTTLEGLMKRRDQRIEAERKRRERELEKVRRDYEFAWIAYEARVREADYDGALRQLQAIQELVREAGEERDFVWARQKQLAEQIRQLEDSLGRALALDRRARQKLRQGSWREARDAWLELMTEYEMTETARHVQLPVRIESRPAGALVLRGGEEIRIEGPAGPEPARTPFVLQLPPDEPVDLELRKPGFESLAVRVVARDDAIVDRVLIAVPRDVIRFEEPVRGELSLRRGVLAAGLRSGKVAFQGLEDSDGAVRFVVQLPGLDELEGHVSFTDAVAVFRTRERRVRAHSLNDGRRLWDVGFPADRGPVFDPLLIGRRVVLIDEHGRLTALDVGRGDREPLWTVSLDEPAEYAPSTDGRFVYVALVSGRVAIVDALEGAVANWLRPPSPPTTSIEAWNGAIVFGTGDARLVALRDNGRREQWSIPLPDDSRAEEILLRDETLFVRAGSHVLRVALRSGEIEASAELPGRVVGGPVVTDDTLFVISRQRAELRDVDVLVALDRANFQWVWEFRGAEPFVADLAALGDDVFVPIGSGDVLRFR